MEYGGCSQTQPLGWRSRATHCASTIWPGVGGGVGAHVGIRTRDLFLTKEVLYRLSYVGLQARGEDRFYSEPLDRLPAPDLREPILSRRFRGASALPPGGVRTAPP